MRFFLKPFKRLFSLNAYDNYADYSGLLERLTEVQVVLFRLCLLNLSHKYFKCIFHILCYRKTSLKYVSEYVYFKRNILFHKLHALNDSPNLILDEIERMLIHSTDNILCVSSVCWLDHCFEISLLDDLFYVSWAHQVMENISGILLIHILLSYEQVVFDLNLIFNVIFHLISCLFNKSIMFSKTNKLYSHFFLIFPIYDVKSNMRAVN